MAGGSGTRLWPKSRQNKPKQFTKVVGKKTMIEQTYDRLHGFYEAKDIYFSTIPAFVAEIERIFPHLPSENIIIEPEKRDNAAAHGFIAAHFSLKDGDEPLAFIPSDHFIEDVVGFHKTIKVAEKRIKKEGKMLDIALPPTFASTVLGYTKVGKMKAREDGVEVYEFLGHTEKPPFATAKKYLKEKCYLWHGNYYMWTPNKFLAAYEKYAPKIFNHLEMIKEALRREDHAAIEKEYAKIEKTSIDFAILEKIDPKEVLILKGDFGWSDIGAFDVLYDLLKVEQDASQNLAEGKWVGLDTSGSYISGPPKKLIATIGVDDLIIIDTKDALLVCPRSRAQDVKKLVEDLKERGEINFI